MVSLGASYTMGPNRRGFNNGFGEDDFMVRGDTTSCFPSMESEGNAHLQQEVNEFLESQVYLQQGSAPPHHHHPQIGTTTTTTAAAGVHVVHGGGGVGTAGEAVVCLGSSYGGLGGYTSPMELAQTLLYDDDDPTSIHHADDHHHRHQEAMNFGHVRTTSPAAVSYGSGLAGGLEFTTSPGSQIAAAGGVNSSVPVGRQVPPRECWLEGNHHHQLSSSSPRGRKRGDNGSLDPPSTLAPRRKIDKGGGQEAAAGRWPKRASDQADHIMRERQRRDDMTSKFLVLESLLPGGAKRDRSTIVDDSIEYVKNLHHRIKVLQQRKLEMKQGASTAALSPRAIQQTPTQRGRITVAAAAAAAAAAEAGAAAAQKLSRRDEDCRTQIKAGATKEDLSEIHALLRSCLEKIDVHVDLPHQVLIELVCRPQRHFQSLIFQCLESLRLDVGQCSITKVAHRVVCVISAQPREVTSPEAIQDIVDSLKQALGADQPLSSSGEEQKT